MMKNKRTIIDICMSILLLLLMSYQITGEFLHEWLGIAMTILVIIHQVLNRKWYTSLFKGKYNLYRFITNSINILLILSFVFTAFCGMSMSNHAVPFLYGMAQISFVRIMHLSMSYWSFTLMGLHLGLHIPAILSKYRIKDKTKNIISIILSLLAGIGLYLYINNGIHNYIFFKEAFAFFDYDKSILIVLIENLLMLLSSVFVGYVLAILSQKNSSNKLLYIIYLMA